MKLLVWARRVSSSQLLRFAVVGVGATAIHTAVYLSLALTHAVSPLTANLAGYCTAVLVSFSGHRYWTFAGHPHSTPASFARFIITSLFGLASNSAITWLLIERLKLPTASALLGIGVTPVLVFLGSKYWVFSARSTD